MAVFKNLLENNTYIGTDASSDLARGTSVAIANLCGNVVALGRDQKLLDQTVDQMEGKNHVSLADDISCADSAFDTIKGAYEITDHEINGIFTALALPHKNSQANSRKTYKYYGHESFCRRRRWCFHVLRRW